MRSGCQIIGDRQTGGRSCFGINGLKRWMMTCDRANGGHTQMRIDRRYAMRPSKAEQSIAIESELPDSEAVLEPDGTDAMFED